MHHCLQKWKEVLKMIKRTGGAVLFQLKYIYPLGVERTGLLPIRREILLRL